MKMILLAATGILSGVISGMGIGGGIVLIPVLCIFMDMKQQAAQNINLIYFIPTAIVALYTHIKNRNIEKTALFQIIITGIAGAVIGSLIAVNIDSGLLRKMFGFFLLFMGILEFLKKGDKKTENR